MSRLLIFYYHF